MDANRKPPRRRHAAAYWKKLVSEHASSGVALRARWHSWPVPVAVDLARTPVRAGELVVVSRLGG